MPNQNGRNRYDERDRDRDQGHRETDHYGGGQSGYGSGRFGDDRTMGPSFRNQASWTHRYDDREGMHTDERFTGRGGAQYWDDRETRDHDRHFEDRGSREHTGYNSGYHSGVTGFGGYGQQGIQQNIGSQRGFRGGSAGAQVAEDYNRGRRYPDEFGPADEGNLGRPGGGDYGQRWESRGQRSGNFGQPMPGGMRGKGPAGYTRSDERIKEEVCDCLSDDDRLDASNIEVTVKDCEVQLTGTVNSREDKRWAETLAERISGVKEVQNNLRVQQEQQRTQTGQTATGGTTTTGTTTTGTTGKEKGREMPH